MLLHEIHIWTENLNHFIYLSHIQFGLVKINKYRYYVICDGTGKSIVYTAARLEADSLALEGDTQGGLSGNGLSAPWLKMKTVYVLGRLILRPKHHYSAFDGGWSSDEFNAWWKLNGKIRSVLHNRNYSKWKELD